MVAHNPWQPNDEIAQIGYFGRDDSPEPNSKCAIEPRGYCLSVRKYSASKGYPDRIRRHRYRRCPYLNASDDHRDD